MIRHSFAPLEPDAVRYLSEACGIDYSRTNFAGPEWLCVTARDDQGAVLGVCVFEFRLWFEAYFTIVVSDRRCVSRRVMRAMFTAVFHRAKRVTTEIPDGVLTSGMAQRMGFVIEGYKRLAIEGVRDALQLGMTADTCRYLRRAPRGSLRPANEVHDEQLAQDY